MAAAAQETAGYEGGAASAVRFRPRVFAGARSGRLIEVMASALLSGTTSAQAPVQPTSRESRLDGPTRCRGNQHCLTTEDSEQYQDAVP